MVDQETQTADIGSAFDLLGKSFNIVKQNWQVFLFVNILSILGSLTALAGNSASKDSSSNATAFESGIRDLSGLQIGVIAGLGIAFVIVFLVVGAYFLVMQQILYTRASAGQKPTIGQVFSEANKRLFKIVLLFLMVGLTILVGFLLLIVPGIIAIGRLAMSPYVMIDKNLGVMDSIKESNRIAKKYTWKVWGAIGVAFIVAFLVSIIQGVIPFAGQILGTLVTIAFSLVVALRYFQLKNLELAEPKPEQTATPAPTPTTLASS